MKQLKHKFDKSRFCIDDVLDVMKVLSKKKKKDKKKSKLKKTCNKK